jgi:hypothetical protein
LHHFDVSILSYSGGIYKFLQYLPLARNLLSPSLFLFSSHSFMGPYTFLIIFLSDIQSVFISFVVSVQISNP